MSKIPPAVSLILLLTVVLAAFGLYFKINPNSGSQPDASKASTACGPEGCNANAMIHSIDITDEKVFIQEMIPHHQEAIDTSRVVLAQTQDPELKKFTQDVIDVQSKEIAQMQGWLKSWFNEEYVVNSGYMPMMGDLSKFEGKALDKMYVEGMIRHHQGAIEMALKVATLNPRPEIQQMADAIISVQQTEVDTLQQWLDTKYRDVDARDEVNHMMDIH